MRERGKHPGPAFTARPTGRGAWSFRGRPGGRDAAPGIVPGLFWRSDEGRRRHCRACAAARIEPHAAVEPEDPPPAGGAARRERVSCRVFGRRPGVLRAALLLLLHPPPPGAAAVGGAGRRCGRTPPGARDRGRSGDAGRGAAEPGSGAVRGKAPRRAGGGAPDHAPSGVHGHEHDGDRPRHPERLRHRRRVLRRDRRLLPRELPAPGAAQAGGGRRGLPAVLRRDGVPAVYRPGRAARGEGAAAARRGDRHRRRGLPRAACTRRPEAADCSGEVGAPRP